MIEVTCYEPVQAHNALNRVIWPHLKANVTAGRRMVLILKEFEDDRTIQQNKYMWVILGEISKQAKPCGVGFLPEGWHWYFKRKFLGYRFNKVSIPGNKRISVIKELRSTTKLSVKKMTEYLDKVQAHAATEFGVEFKDKNWQQWNGMIVDADTGEIQEAS